MAGMTIGAAVLFGFGIVWFVWGTYHGRHVPASLAKTLSLAGVILLVWIGILGLRAARAGRFAPQPTSEQRKAGQQIGRRFSEISELEGAAIIVAVVVLNVVHRSHAIGPVIALIVGVHFFPLAGLFGVLTYYATGALGCLIGIIGFCIDDFRLRRTVVGFSFGCLLWITAVTMLIRASQFRT